MLRELATNLIDNAVRYTPARGHVTVRSGTAAGMAFLEVEDNGVGIPPEERAKVIERFYRVPDSPGSGSGLGLAIANDIVNAHAGALRLAEPPDHHGTIVRAEFRETEMRDAPAPPAGGATVPPNS
jgi:two-component system sensor histidine kinase TctE